MAFWKKKEDELGAEGATVSPAADSYGSNQLKPQGDPPPAVIPSVAPSVTPATAPKQSASVTPTPPTQSSEAGDKSGLCQPDDLIAQRHEKVRSALGPGTVIQGKLSFDTPVRIDGKLSGEVFSSRALIVGKSGQIDANVEVASLIVYGSVKGSIRATEKVEIYEGGSLDGELKTPALMVESGAKLNAECDMGSRSKVLPVSESDRTAGEKSKERKQKETAVITDAPINLQSVYEKEDEESKDDVAPGSTTAPTPH
ncbi:MAG: polymer-forming cytoskeletal protein [Deltaproteobacteria bacterium]|nr:polymer-forming cytoskeletal protein [Deltaproteobacteria bacterium]